MTSPPSAGTWTGEWVHAHAGLELAGDAGLPDLVGLAVRRNPRRLQLVVSNVLAKHVPVAPASARAAADRLGDLVLEALDGARPDLVLGYAETATGLGHLVADRVGAPVLHSTRRPGWSALSFEEEHSHATTHRLQPADEGWLRTTGPLVLVDDELTTGRTLLNTVRELHAACPREAYVVAALVDLRPDAARALVDEAAAELGARIEVVALARGEVRVGGEPDAAVAAALDTALPPPPAPRADEVATTVTWPADVPTGGRHGLRAADAAFDAAVAALAAEVDGLLVGDAVHVLGTEELMYLPHRLAEALDHREVTVSSTTRSPVVVVDDPGYAVRHGITFAAHDGADDGAPRFAYNLEPGRFDTIVLVVDAATPAPADGGAADLRAALAGLCERVVVARVGE
ncbi:hypothetical protein GCM10023340_30770 [Nocardioides marinquilinus]|uniref:TRSP domain C terminus to PRTase_2 n=1 Tax=Nocardioides marinquilinus TaxID=1210400 RepID=A0ABP9PZJ1_9ACTN